MNEQMDSNKPTGDKELWDLIVNYYPAFEGQIGEDNKHGLFEKVSKLIERRRKSMRFHLEHNLKERCWKIYDLQNAKQIEEPPLMWTIAETRFDEMLLGLLIMHGIMRDWEVRGIRK